MQIDTQQLRKFTLALSLSKGLGPRTFLQIINKALCKELELLADVTKQDLGDLQEKIFVEGYQQDDEVKKLHSHYEDMKVSYERIQDSVDSLSKDKIQYVCFWEEGYPQELLNTYSPPLVLYYLGKYDSSIFSSSIAVVGTRKPTHLGSHLARSFAVSLAENGFNIVSGMAMGIDAAALNGCLETTTKPIAVIGTAVNDPSPKSNRKLYDKILANDGIILSEVFPGERINNSNFITRNRIIAALSKATLVVEAGEGSGALETAARAFEYDRLLFAIPGTVGQPNSTGVNKLIKTGQAKLVEDVEDILEELGLVLYKGKKDRQQVRQLQSLTDLQLNVYKQVLAEPLSLDELCVKLELDASSMLTVLTELELQKLIIKNTEGKYRVLV